MNIRLKSCWSIIKWNIDARCWIARCLNFNVWYSNDEMSFNFNQRFNEDKDAKNKVYCQHCYHFRIWDEREKARFLTSDRVECCSGLGSPVLASAALAVLLLCQCCSVWRHCNNLLHHSLDSGHSSGNCPCRGCQGRGCPPALMLDGWYIQWPWLAVTTPSDDTRTLMMPPYT